MSEKKKVDFTKMEKKWQEEWEKSKIFEVSENSKKGKYYVLEMYPYPSSSGLHIGHAFNYTIGDIFSRFKRMQGFNVLHPMGYDSFGLPAENAAIKAKSHPKIFTDKAIENFVRQQKSLGLGYDWTRELESHDPGYYKWNQYFFLKFLEKGLAYRKKASVNYCPKCDTVLANEQVHQGKCWRHTDTDVEIKQLEQWFLKTSEYADELLETGKLDWPSRIKTMQENWIGRSEGSEIDFSIDGNKWKVFTTRADTIFGVTFLVISAQHPKLMEIVTSKQKKEVEKFLKKIKSTSEKDAFELEKEGVFTGSFAVNPINNDKIPVYAGNFVVADYGSGMVMAVPAHDQRDYEFAKKYKIPVKEVIKGERSKIKEHAYTDYGILINSDRFNGLSSKEAIDEITSFLEKKKLGRKVTQYKLRDWLLSRQRYWGTPIPVVHCSSCGIVPVPEKELPILLPEKVKFGEGNPLLSAKSWLEVRCPKCGKMGRRETDTMDTFFDSSWYYLRFTDNNNKKEAFERRKVSYWMPVDFYTGGAEHACMHLIYARFFTKVLRDLGMLDFDEPFKKLFNQGMVHGEDGAVMSKSRGNVVDPLDITGKYGADALRMFLVSMASPDRDSMWNQAGLESIYKFLIKIFEKISEIKIKKSSEKISHKVNLAVKQVTGDIESLQYNLAIIKLRNLFEFFEREISREDLESSLKLLSIFCPHISEEIWHNLGNKSFVSVSNWPEVDEKKINMKLEEEEKLNDTLVNDINNILKIVREKGDDKKKASVYCVPKELESYNVGEIERRTNLKIKIFSVADKGKYDPENKANKAKPGKPAIFLE